MTIPPDGTPEDPQPTQAFPAVPDEPAVEPDATQAMPAETSADAGWLLGGRYRVRDRIGVGGMADVFRAHDELLKRDVAVKVFRSHADPTDTAAGQQRQEIELRSLAQLSHPNLITLFDGSISHPGQPAYLVMELIEGPSLSARIAEAPLGPAEAAVVAAQIADALAYVHSRGMVHRDIKPANILLGTDGSGDPDAAMRARLSDFGIVRLLDSDHLTRADFMVGTASYLAPEQARGAEVGPPADVYALGLVMIEALTGVKSFPGPAMEAVRARLVRSPDIPQQLPAPWPALLRSMTATDPALRPTAAAVAATLRGSVPAGTLAVGPTLSPAAAAAIAAAGAATSYLPTVPAAVPLAEPPATGAHAAPASSGSGTYGSADVGKSGSGKLIGGLIAAGVVIAGLIAAVFVIAHNGNSDDPTTVPSTGASSSASTTAPTSSAPATSDSPSDPTSDDATSTEPTTTAPTTTAPSTTAPTTTAPTTTAPTTTAPTTTAPTTTAPTTTAPTTSAPVTTAPAASTTGATPSPTAPTPSPTVTG